MTTKREGKITYLFRNKFVWCTQYKKPVIKGEIERFLVETLRKKTEEQGAVPVMVAPKEDQVWIIVDTSPNINLVNFARNLKRVTASALKEEFPGLKKVMSSIWDGQVLIGSEDAGMRFENVQDFVDGVKTRYPKENRKNDKQKDGAHN